MGTETLTPSSVISDNGWSAGDPLDLAAIDTLGDGDWAIAIGNNTNSDIHVAVDNPTADLKTGAGLQTVNVEVRQFDDGQTGDPDVRIEIWENGNGTALAVGSDVPVTSATPATVSLTFDATLLADPSGVDLEIKVFGTKAGGSPGTRNTIDVGGIEFVADLAAAAKQISLVAGSFGFTGLTPTLSKLLTLTIASGSMAFTGLTTDLSKLKQLALAAGAMGFTGLTNAISKVREYTVTGTFGFTGETAALVKCRVLDLIKGTFGFTGLAVTIVTEALKQIILTAGSFAFSSPPIAISRVKKLALVAASFAFTGLTAGINRLKLLNLSAASFGFTSPAMTLFSNRAVQLAAAAIVFTGTTSVLVKMRMMEVGAAVFSIRGQTLISPSRPNPLISGLKDALKKLLTRSLDASN